MKTNFLIVLATAAASVLANPAANLDGNLAARSGTCHKPSSCSKFWAGKCEQYCDPYKFSHMTGDGCNRLPPGCLPVLCRADRIYHIVSSDLKSNGRRELNV
ncbi:hypothetical protein P168DRAFT_281476 [Aspergillus campestris IBT 28561]|uniref:Uncharacterized protein n=1 Tax=Aspergillus campestris (strain IBT 28561) TaxID=1392248 RepID=A0A2I1D5J3_ASPC2|nr:uncharacterized protein P168DRAFT_281476 [Aspergillus campestris IBT 28561]PKY05142.1 hypothetical protein P168DRAFT_281476 [Aspergillus campestris IBT 28561]